MVATVGEGNGDNGYSWIWKSKASPKVHSLVWKMARDIIMVSIKLRQRIHVDQQCNVCLTELEMVEHALYTCPIAMRVWQQQYELSRRSLKIQRFEEILSCLKK